MSGNGNESNPVVGACRKCQYILRRSHGDWIRVSNLRINPPAKDEIPDSDGVWGITQKEALAAGKEVGLSLESLIHRNCLRVLVLRHRKARVVIPMTLSGRVFVSAA